MNRAPTTYGVIRNTHNILVENLDGEDRIRDLDIDGRIILK
jgi:hypothetical protein